MRSTTHQPADPASRQPTDAQADTDERDKYATHFEQLTVPTGTALLPAWMRGLFARKASSRAR
jgi:hypothetical protein